VQPPSTNLSSDTDLDTGLEIRPDTAASLNKNHNSATTNSLIAHPDDPCEHHSHHVNQEAVSREHVHSEASRKRIVNRLSRIEGHLRGIKTMVQDDRPCPDVLIQLAAVRGGIERVARIILDEHLSECITRAVDEGNIEAEVEALKSALDRFI